jgi:signal transduction histidine kinase
MRRLSLGTLLIGVNVGLVLLVVLCVAAAAASLLRRFADQQAMARASVAGARAERIIERTSQEISSQARLLAEDPTLLRLVVTKDARAIEALLRRFCPPAELRGCAVVLGGRRFASVGETSLPWEELARTWADPRGAGILSPGSGPLVFGHAAAILGIPEGIVVVALPMNEALAQAVGRQVGLPVAILDRTAALEWSAPAASARGRAVDLDQPIADRLDPDGVYLAEVPLRSSSGEVIGLLETRLPATDVTAPLRRLARALLILAILVAGSATLLSVLLGWLLIHPLEDLTEASARMGLGDLATPIPHAPGAEIGSLADTMEEMRRRLLHVTEALRQRQSEAEAVVAGIVEGVYAVDLERRIAFLNPQAAALLGTTPEKAMGRFCGDVLNPQGADGIRPCEDRCPIVHARYRGSARATESLLLPDGSRRSVVITSASIDAGGSGTDTGGSTLAVRQFQVIRDETDIEATRRLRDTVLANITHEFRTPLSAQLASIELLRDRLGQLSLEEVRDLVASLERGTLRLTHLIDNLLESVRIDAGQGSIRRQPVALEMVIHEALELTSSLVALRAQRLDVQLPEDLPRILGDGPRLVQVFVNLLANANKFAPAGTTIRLGGSVDDHEVTVWVEDEGPGIKPRDGAVLFERFMRSPGEEPAESGMGLGLWIVKSIVERHGGRVEARHGGGGKPGTRMCVILPAGDMT